MSVDKTKKFHEDEIENGGAEEIYWQIQGLYEEIQQKEREYQKFADTIFLKIAEKNVLLEKVQNACGQSPGGHKFLLFKEAILEWDRNVYKCQKCTLKTS